MFAVPTMDRAAAANAIDAFLRAIGRDAGKEPDLVGTGARVADAFIDELCAGYAIDGRALVEKHAIDASGGETPSVIVVRDIPVVTTCPHHLLPAVGSADVAMLAKTRIVGIGAIGELVDAHARRLALQEHIGERVVSDLDAVLAPEWIACRLLLSHGCMIARGSRPIGTRVETMALRRVDAATVTTILGSAS
jgi:GTP cyclohydrolase IA